MSKVVTEQRVPVEVDRDKLSVNWSSVGRFTIVTVEDANGKKGHGISRCSEKDDFNKVAGFEKAKARAIQSLRNKLNGVHNRSWYLG